MQLLKIAENVSGTAVAAQTAVSSNLTPFGAGRDVVIDVLPTVTPTGTPTVLIQSSPDNVTWTTVITHTALYEKRYAVKCQRYMRFNCTVAGTAGSWSAYAINGA